MAHGTALVGTLLPRSGRDLLDVLGCISDPMPCDVVELRLDRLDDAEERLAEYIAASPLPVIATCRRVDEGGLVPRDEDARLALLATASDAGAAWIDVEWDVPSERVPRGDAAVLRSAHLDVLPADPSAFVARLLDDADEAKLVIADGSAATVLAVMTLIRDHAGRLAAHCLDAPITRFAAPLLGGRFTYAALAVRAPFAFPMPTVVEAAQCMGRGRSSPSTRAFLLLGSSVDSSVSPWMLRKAFADAGRDLISLPWSLDDVLPALEAIRRFDWAGAAVTMPFKESVFDWVRRGGGELLESAVSVGSANTVMWRDGRFTAANTDVGGLLDTLRQEPPVTLDGAAGLVIGAGGAARAAVRAIQALGGQPVVWSRRPAQAAALAQAMSADGADVRAVAAPEPTLRAGPGLVVNATPAVDPRCPPGLLPRSAVVVDMVAARVETALLRRARAAGHDVRSGLSMLVHQAARQVRLLTGDDPDRTLMEQAARARLDRMARRVVLLGLRATGKSTLGALVAGLLGMPFADVDDLVAERAGETPDGLIASGREQEFREHERAVLALLVHFDGVVVATGGGAVLHTGELESLCKGALVVLLDADDDVLLERLEASPRAALSDLDAAEELGRQRAERMAAYRSAADVILDTGAHAAVSLADTIADAFMPSPAD